jgi:hypothetical protein
MNCSHCGRSTSWVSTKCRTCSRRLPAWYVLAAVIVLVVIYGAFLAVENIF